MKQFLLNNIHYYSTQMWNEFGDRRVKHLPGFTAGPQTILITIIIYLIVVLKIIPYFMRNRPPYPLRSTIRCYNILLVLINGFYFFYELKQLNYGQSLIRDFS